MSLYAYRFACRVHEAPSYPNLYAKIPTESRGAESVEYFYLAGNHDIGYGFDMSKQLVERFERAIGSPLNYEFQAVGHRFIAINAQAVDATNDRDLHEQVWGFIRNRSRLSDTRISDDPIILLTHIPLHKPHGLCNDGPEASYYHE